MRAAGRRGCDHVGRCATRPGSQRRIHPGEYPLEAHPCGGGAGSMASAWGFQRVGRHPLRVDHWRKRGAGPLFTARGLRASDILLIRRMRLPIICLSLALLACMCPGVPSSGGGGGGGTSYVPKPNIVVGAADVTVCGGVFSDCVRVECSMLNAGDAAGSTSVRLDVTDSSGKAYQVTENVTLQPGERTTVSHDFQGADDDGTSYGSCNPQ